MSLQATDNTAFQSSKRPLPKTKRNRCDRSWPGPGGTPGPPPGATEALPVAHCWQIEQHMLCRAVRAAIFTPIALTLRKVSAHLHRPKPSTKPRLCMVRSAFTDSNASASQEKQRDLRQNLHHLRRKNKRGTRSNIWRIPRGVHPTASQEQSRLWHSC